MGLAPPLGAYEDARHPERAGWRPALGVSALESPSDGLPRKWFQSG